MKNSVYIVAGARSAIVPSGGLFKNLNYYDLASPVIQHCLNAIGLPPNKVDELIVSNALGGGGNPARLVALASGLPQNLAGLSIDRQCVGGLDSLLVGKDLILSGQAQVVIAGGAESYSLRPKRYYKSLKEKKYIYQSQAPFLPSIYNDPLMEVAAGELANQSNITKTEQHEWAIESHTKALRAKSELSKEIVTIPKAPIDHDPYARSLTMETCQRSKVLSASVSTASTSVAADGAAFVVMVSEKALNTLSIHHALRIIDGKTSGGNPELPGLAPISVNDLLLKKNQLSVLDLDVIELMEAYAAQAIICAKELKLPIDRINLSGGSLSRGHPIGASGAVLAVRMLNELKNERKIGLATIAGAGGIATGILFENITFNNS